MPLHADIERMRWIFQAFDDAVGCMSCDAQALPYVPDGLMMRGVHLQLLTIKDRRQPCPFFNEHVMTMPIARLAGVIDIRLDLGRDVLNQRSTGGNIHHLHAETDAECRN